MDKCDLCGDTATLVVITPRPSFPSELVAVMMVCSTCNSTPICTTVDKIAEMFAGGATHLVASASLLEEYIESPYSQQQGHIFLTI